jgi:hypothetical protein
MSDWVAERSAQMHDPGFGLGLEGTLKWFLIATATAVMFVGSYFIGFLIGSGAEPEPVDGPSPAAAMPAEEARVLLTVRIEGAGGGRVRIEPRGAACAETCDREFSAGTRVTLTAEPVKGSRFEGWDDTCAGDEDGRKCSFVLDREREVSATFEGTPTPSECADGRDNDRDRFIDGADPGCRGDASEAPDNTPKPGEDCSDGRDNDSDGLIDRAQDPGCERDDTEAEGSAVPVAPPPPVAVAPPASSECSDGRDNDGDGLVDRAQDPDCVRGTTEGGPPTPTQSECRDGIDNDGDRKVDRPADPGCDADATEAGG